MENKPQENIIEELYQARYEKLDNIIIKKFHEITASSEEEKIGKKYAIIMEEIPKKKATFLAKSLAKLRLV